jgi:uncharacterized protein YhaN
VRVVSLHLDRYGRFTDCKLEFPRNADLCLVYGPNEAGKSTALSGLCDFLFGFPHHAEYDFLHEKKLLRVGGTLLRSDGGEIMARRRRGRENTLLGLDERPLPESVLAPYLGGVGRDQFMRVFGVDQVRLQAGGEAMLAADGAVGAILLEAGEGVRDLLKVQRGLEERAARLYAPRRSGERLVYQALDALKAARGQLKERQLLADDWAQAVAAVKAAEQELEEVQERQRVLAARRSQLERIRATKPILNEVDDREAELAALADTPDVPATFAERHAELELQKATRAEMRRAAEARLVDAEQALVALPPRDAITDMADEIALLADRRGADLKAAEDLPRRQGEVAAELAALEQIARELDISGAEALRAEPPKAIAVAEVARLARIGREHRTALQEATRRLADAQEHVGPDGGGIVPPEPATNPGSYRQRLERLRRLPESERKLAAAAARHDHEGRELALDLAALPLWSGDLETLTAAPVPDVAMLDRFLQAHQALSQHRQRLEGQQDDARQAHAALLRRLDELDAEGPVPTMEALGEARRARDRTWRLLRRRYVEGEAAAMEEADETRAEEDSATVAADRYEELLQRADDIVDRRARETDRVVDYRKTTASRLDLERGLEEIGVRLAMVAAEEERLDAEWRELWRPVGIEPLSPPKMTGWIEERRRLLAARRDLARKVAEQEEEASAVAASRAALGRLVIDICCHSEVEIGAEVLLDRVEEVITGREQAWEEELGRQGRAALARETFEQARQAQERARSASETWNNAWQAALQEASLPANLSIEAGEAACGLLTRAAGHLERLATADHRIQTMHRDRFVFADAVRDLIRRHGGGSDEGDPVAASRVLEECLRQAQRVETERTRLEALCILERDNVASARRELEEVGATLVAMRAEIGASEAAEVPGIIERARRWSDCRKELRQSRERLHGIGDGLDEAALRREAANMQPDEVIALLDETKRTQASLSDELITAGERRSQAKARLTELERRTGADEAAQAAADAMALLGETTANWARLRATSLLLKAAVDRYREQQQHPMLAAAGRYLARLTSSSFSGFAIEYDEKDAPRLAAQRADTGAPVPVSGLSEGTRDQLWLALRLAAIERHATANEPLPFIGDDVFVNFDDERTVAGLEALADLGACCQVLLFTHHRHVLDLATSSLGTRMAAVEL